MSMLYRLAFVSWLAGLIFIGYFGFRYIPFVWEDRFCESIYAEQSALYTELFRLQKIAEQEYDEAESTHERKEKLRLEELEDKKVNGKFWTPREYKIKPLFPPFDITEIPRRNGFDQDLHQCNLRPLVLEDGGVDTRIYGGVGVLLLVICYVLSGKLVFNFPRRNRH